MATKKKIPSMPGKKVTASQRAAGMSAMSKAMGHRVGSTKAQKEHSNHKAKKF